MLLLDQFSSGMVSSAGCGAGMVGAACSPARSRISLLLPPVGVAMLVDSSMDKAMMVMTKPQVRRSSKSPVFLTPMMLDAPEPPN